MPLINEVIEAPRNFEGEAFTGRTVLSYDHRTGDEVSTFTNCTFEYGSLANGGYALFVPPDRKPYASFEGCTFKNSARGAVAQFCRFIDCNITGANDGIVAQILGALHIEGCHFSDIGHGEEVHADGIQFLGGRNSTIKGNTFDMPDRPEIAQYVNSWIFIESALAPVRGIRVVGNKGTGGNYHVYLWNDKHGPPTGCEVGYNAWHGHKFARPVAWNEGVKWNYEENREANYAHDNEHVDAWPVPE